MTILPQNHIAFSNKVYYNITCKKSLPFYNSFYKTPYFIIYTPLETPDSSPVRGFNLFMVFFFCSSKQIERKLFEDPDRAIRICLRCFFFYDWFLFFRSLYSLNLDLLFRCRRRLSGCRSFLCCGRSRTFDALLTYRHS